MLQVLVINQKLVPASNEDLKYRSVRPGMFMRSLIQHILPYARITNMAMWFLNHGPCTVVYWRWQAELSRQAKSPCVCSLAIAGRKLARRV